MRYAIWNYPVRDAKKKKKNDKKWKKSLQDSWDIETEKIICIMGISEDKREKRTGSLFKAIMAEYFPNVEGI